jgi:hypothetical protein
MTTLQLIQVILLSISFGAVAFAIFKRKNVYSLLFSLAVAYLWIDSFYSFKDDHPLLTAIITFIAFSILYSNIVNRRDTE